MTNRILLIVSLNLLVITAFGQDISRQEADSMLYALDKSKPDLDRIDLLLNLAQFHIFKPGEFQIDFDSAMVYINQAKVLNRTLKSSDADGYALLTESILVREKGLKDEAKKMTEKAIKILESGANKFYLAVGYYELAFYYDFNQREELLQKIQLVEKSVKLFRQTGNHKEKGPCPRNAR